MAEEMKMELKPIFFERAKLLDDTLNCRRTDHVLAAPMIMYLPITLYNQTTMQAAMTDYDAVAESYIRYHQEFQPDLSWGPQALYPITSLDDLDCQYLQWPGKHFADPNRAFQVVDQEDGYMDGEEYLEYAEDPTGFMMRKILPRHYGALKGLEKVDFSNMVWQDGLYGMIPFADPSAQAAFQALGKAGAQMQHMYEAGGKIVGALAGMGFPSACDGALTAPFDMFNDTLRGFLNTSMDMIEYPDELLAALETATKIQVRHIKNKFKREPFCKNVVFFLHNGFDSFMSREQFETFYWPGLKKCVEAVVECGGVPNLYIEDKYDSKMDIIARDIPVNKCIITMINCDVEKAKSLFAGKAALSGGVSGTLLQYGTKDEVVKHVKDTIDLWAPGGGYFLNCDVSLDIAKTENLHALFDTAKNYMKY